MRPRLRLLVALLGAIVLPASAAPPPGLETLEVPAMTFHYPPSHAALAADLARRGPGELARVADELGLPAPSHVDVYLFPRRVALDPGRWGLPAGPEWAAGFTLSSVPIVVLRTDEDVGPYGNEASSVLTHELVHAVTTHALGDRHAALPAWLREGVASMLAFEWRLPDTADATRFALSTEYLPLAEVTRSFPSDAARAQHAYLESFAFVSWLREREGKEGLRDLFGRLHGGEDFHAAFRAAYGASPGQLEKKWKRGFLFTYRWVPILTGSTTLWVGATLLFVTAWARKRRRSSRMLRAWEVEEAAADRAGRGEEGGAPGEDEP